MLRETQSWPTEEWRLEEPSCAGGAAPQGKATAPAPLTRLEQTVVAMSLFDHPSSIEAPGGLMRRMMRLLGMAPANRLSNDRLETLRRYSILLRVSGGAAPDEEVRLMRDVDFSDGALNQISRLIARG